MKLSPKIAGNHRPSYSPWISRSLAWMAVTAVLIVAAPALLATPEVAQRSPAVQKALNLIAEGEFKAAATTCQRAKDLEASEHHLCLLATAVAWNRAKSFEQAEEAAKELIAAAASQELISGGHRELGFALVGQLRSKHRMWPQIKLSRRALKKLEAAEAALRRSIESPGDHAATRIALADVLSGLLIYHQKWDYEEEIREILFEYLDRYPDSKDAEWARAITCTSKRYEDLIWDPRNPPPEENSNEQQVSGPEPVQIDSKKGIGRPEKLEVRLPKYSALARLAKLEGTVLLQAIIDREGKIASAVPLVGLPLCLTEEAILAVQEWTFKPAMQNGEPVSVYYNLVVNFRLE